MVREEYFFVTRGCEGWFVWLQMKSTVWQHQFVIDRRVMIIIWPPAVENTCRWTWKTAQIEQIRRGWVMYGAVTAPFFIGRRRNGAVHLATAPGRRRSSLYGALPWFAVVCRTFQLTGPRTLYVRKMSGWCSNSTQWWRIFMLALLSSMCLSPQSNSIPRLLLPW